MHYVTRVIRKFLVLIELEIKCLYTIRTVKWKQNFIQTDVKGRRCGYRIGLETLVDHTENDECHIFIYEYINKCENIPPYE